MNKNTLPRYMIATKAIHKLGDISREKEDICLIHKEENEYYIGNWVTGLGFIDVKFPIKTTRELSEKEVENYDGTAIALSGHVSFIDITNTFKFPKVKIVKQNSGKTYEGTLLIPIKKLNSIIIDRKDGKRFHSSTIQKINKNEITTNNSTYLIEYL